MLLYHGSFVEVNSPSIMASEKGKDFGFAFYLTPIKEQAERMAIRKRKQTHSNKAIVSVYEWDENKADLNYKCFVNPNLGLRTGILGCSTAEMKVSYLLKRNNTND